MRVKNCTVPFVVQTIGNKTEEGMLTMKKNEINRKNSIKQETIFPEHFSIVPVEKIYKTKLLWINTRKWDFRTDHTLAQFCPSIGLGVERIFYRKVTCRRLFIRRMRMGSEIAIFFSRILHAIHIHTSMNKWATMRML